jgi:hypothetical protein
MVRKGREMTITVRIDSLRHVADAQVVLVGAASLRGSGIFGGAFEVADADACIATDAKTGAQTVTVLCRCLGDPGDVEELVLELHDPVPHLVVGFVGEVVERVAVEWTNILPTAVLTSPGEIRE